MNIYGFNKLTLLDYPKHMAATIFTGGCNFRCPFCHNASLVLCPQTQHQYDWSEIYEFLKKRKNTLEGICFTGGEPTLYQDLPEYIKQVKDLGYKVKLDTNGTNYSLVETLLNSHLLDYVAMDIKNSKDKYAITTGVTEPSLESVDNCIDLLLNSTISYEFRTTVVKELHTSDDLESIAHWIKGARAYYLQAFKDSGDLIDNGYSGYRKDELQGFLEIIKPYVDECGIRGID